MRSVARVPLRFARPLAASVLALVLGVSAPRPAEASVSLAVLFDDLVADADVVAVVSAVEKKSAWEDGRIYTYTRLAVDETVAGEPAREVWVKTLGGVVDQVGQVVDGEPTFTPGTRSLVFLHRLEAATFVVASRSQGQYVVGKTTKDGAPRTELVRAQNVGALLFPNAQARAKVRAPRAVATRFAGALAQDVLQFRTLDAARTDIAEAFKKLHAP